MSMKLLYFLLFLLFSITNLQAQIVEIPDAHFKKKLIQLGIDKNSDGEIQNTEAETVDSLYLRNACISDLTGIESFIHLKYLDCSTNFTNSFQAISSSSFQGCTSNHITNTQSK